MLDCPRCGRRVPEVIGAPEQECPHCGAFIVTEPQAPSRPSPATPRPAAPARPVVSSPEPPGAAPRPHPAEFVDEAPRRGGTDPAGALMRGFAIHRANFGTFAKFWVPVLVADLVLSFALLAWDGATGPIGALEPTPANLPTFLRYLGLALPLYFLLWTVKLAYWGAHAPLVLQALHGERVDPSAAFATLRVRAVPIAATAAALAILYAASGFFFLVPFVFFFHFYVFAPVAAAEADGGGVADALARSRGVARRNRTLGFTVAVLLVILGAFLVAAAASKLALAAATAVAPAWALMAEHVAASVVAWLIAPLSATIVATYWFGATRGLPEAPTLLAEPRPAPAVAPSGGAADAWGAPRRERVEEKNTKCPGCGTVFGYAPSADGAAVHVECPRCGKAGLVR